MRKGQKRKQSAPIEPTVYCSECCHFERDTAGISRRQDGTYYMGVCAIGLTPDTTKKQFADKPRKCRKYSSI